MISNDQFGYLYLTIWIHVGCPLYHEKCFEKQLTNRLGIDDQPNGDINTYQHPPARVEVGLLSSAPQTPIHPFGRSQVPHGSFCCCSTYQKPTEKIMGCKNNGCFAKKRATRVANKPPGSQDRQFMGNPYE